MDTHQRLPKNHRTHGHFGCSPRTLCAFDGPLLCAHGDASAVLQAGLSTLRLSFTKSLRILRQAVFEFQVVCESQFAGLHKRLLNDIAQAQLPERVHRSNPRVVKRKMSNFEKKRQQHRTWPQPTKPFSEAGALLI